MKEATKTFLEYFEVCRFTFPASFAKNTKFFHLYGRQNDNWLNWFLALFALC